MQGDILVLADIVVGTGLLVSPLEALETRVRHVLLVQRPTDALVLEKVDYRRDVRGHRSEWVTVETEVVSANSRHIVGLGRVSDSIVLGQHDALLGKRGEVSWNWS